MITRRTTLETNKETKEMEVGVQPLDALLTQLDLKNSDLVEASRDQPNLFIYPPYEFKIPSRMITNFHLPKSTLLMLTGAFAGYERLMRAYREAIDSDYRFYSYGDAMLIL